MAKEFKDIDTLSAATEQIEVAGRVVEARALTLRDLGLIRRRMRVLAQLAYDDYLKETGARPVLEVVQAQRAATNIAVITEAALREWVINTDEGTTLVAWIVAHDTEPKLTLEQVDKEFSNDAIFTVAMAVLRLSGWLRALTDEEKKVTGEDERTEPNSSPGGNETSPS